jgi:hypothetical protein
MIAADSLKAPLRGVTVVAVLMLVNYFTLDRYPLSWIDEVMYADPAVNLASGYGFVSSAWGSQSFDEFWASNAPLYSLLLAGWLTAFDVEWLNVRGFSLIIAAVGALSFTSAVRNFNLVKRRDDLGYFLIALLTIFPFVYSYRIGRPDVLGMCLSALLLYSLSLPTSNLRKLFVIIFAASLIWTSLAVALFVTLQSGIVLLFYRRAFFRDLLLIAGGLVLGALSLAVFLLVNDAFIRFSMIAVGSGHTLPGQLGQLLVYGETRIFDKFLSLPGAYIGALFFFPYTMTLMLLATMVCTVASRPNRLQLMLLTSAFLIPLLLLVAGKYTWHYSWIHFSIMLVFLFSYADSIRASKLRVLAPVWLAVTCLLGLPWLIGYTLNDWKALDPQLLSEFVDKNVQSDDVLVADASVYFLARARGARVLTTNYGGGKGLPEVPDNQKASITKLIIPSDLLERMSIKFTGNWSKSASISMVQNKGFMGIRSGEFYELGRPTLTVYERRGKAFE